MSITGHSRKYRLIGEKLIRDLPEFEDIRESGARIAYLSSDEEKRKNYKTVFADCNRVSNRYSWCCKYDFFIVVYEPNAAEFTDLQLRTLIRHELHHVGVDYSGDEMKFYVVPHDVEEFDVIIRECGLHWSDEICREEQIQEAERT